MAETAEYEGQLTGLLNLDDGFRAPGSVAWLAKADPSATNAALNVMRRSVAHGPQLAEQAP